jgi:hypothetical protein
VTFRVTTAAKAKNSELRDDGTSRDHAKILLVILLDFDKSADHEMCSSDHGRFRCVRFTSVRGATTALSSESGAAIWRRSDRDRKGFDPTFRKTSACNSAKVRAVSAAKMQARPPA